MRSWIFTIVFLCSAAFAQQEGVEVKKSRLLLLPKARVEAMSAQQYNQLMRGAVKKGVLMVAGVNIAAALLNLSNVSASLLAQAGDLALTLPYARSGYDPRAALTVRRKMARLSATRGQPQFLSTHPAHAIRIHDIEAQLPRVIPLYEAARGINRVE